MNKLALTIPGLTGGITPPQEIQTIANKTTGYGGNLFGVAIGVLFVFAAVTATFFLVWGGIQWISSEGDAKSVSQARSTILYACIGLGVTFLSYLVINFLAHFFGANLLGPS